MQEQSLVVPQLCASAAPDSRHPRLFDTFPRAAPQCREMRGRASENPRQCALSTLVGACAQPIAFSQAIATETKQIRFAGPGSNPGSTARPNALARYQAVCFLGYAAINTAGSGW